MTASVVLSSVAAAAVNAGESDACLIVEATP